MRELPAWLFEVPVGTLIPCDKVPLFPTRRPEVMRGDRITVLVWTQIAMANDEFEEYWLVSEQGKLEPW